MRELNLELHVKNKNVGVQPPLMKYPKQYELTFEETLLPILPPGYIEVCPSCGALLKPWEYQPEVLTQKNDMQLELFPTSA